MKLISHRGNINGVEPSKENDPSYIDLALESYEVEIDIRLVKNEFMLGHDLGQYLVTKDWLQDRAKKLWVHCKDYQSFSSLCETNIKAFYHSVEPCVAVRNSDLIWCHRLADADHNSIVPLLEVNSLLLRKSLNGGNGVGAICSDYPSQIK